MEIKSKEIELVDIGLLQHHPKNCHKHSDEQIDRLVKLIEYQGFRNPLIVQKGTQFVVAGNGRLMAAKKMGFKQLPVIYQEFESEAQIYAYIVSDNAIGKDAWATLDISQINTDIGDLGPDFDIDLLGLKDFQLDVSAKGLTDEDAVPEVKENPICKSGDLWILGDHRLLCGDCTVKDNVDRLMNGEKADMVFTDPPYGIGYEYNKHIDEKGEEYLCFCNKWFEILKENSDIIFITTGWKYLPFWYNKNPNNTFYWTMKGKHSRGVDCYFRLTEQILIWGKSKNTFNFDTFENTNKKIFVGEANLRDLHSCPKPVELVEWIISAINTKEIVLDLFLGSGTTIISCEKTGRKCYGMEIDPKYCDVIINRWKDFTGKEAILEGTGEKYNVLSNLHTKTKEA